MVVCSVHRLINDFITLKCDIQIICIQLYVYITYYSLSIHGHLHWNHQTAMPNNWTNACRLYRFTFNTSGILKVAVVRPSLRSLILSSSLRVSYSIGSRSVRTAKVSIPPSPNQPSWEHPCRQENSFTLNCKVPICQCTKQQAYLYSSHDHSVLLQCALAIHLLMLIGNGR